MPGNMGNKKCSVQNLQILRIDPQESLLYVAGSVPSASGQFVNVKDAVMKLWTKKCFPEGTQVPFPTFTDDSTKLPLEMLPPPPTEKESKLDPFLRQKHEATR
jgi:hypothetical protein